MAKAHLTLPDGTTVTIEGSPDEISKILAIHQRAGGQNAPKVSLKGKKRKTAKIELRGDSEVSLSEIVTTAKNCDEAELIEKNVLDRSSQVDRTLLPLYVTQKYLNDSIKLTTGEISKILSELGINILVPNVAKTLSTTASKYVIGDKMRKKGQPVKYKLSRRGEQYLSSVIAGETDG